MRRRLRGADVRLDGSSAHLLAVAEHVPQLLPDLRDAVGFNAMQPGKIKKGDIVMLVAAIVVILALVIWAVR